MDCQYIQTSEGRQDNWTDPGLGFRYHIRSVAASAHLSRSDPGSLQQNVHHSDQGVQYASHDYVDCLKEHLRMPIKTYGVLLRRCTTEEAAFSSWHNVGYRAYNLSYYQITEK